MVFLFLPATRSGYIWVIRRNVGKSVKKNILMHAETSNNNNCFYFINPYKQNKNKCSDARHWQLYQLWHCFWKYIFAFNVNTVLYTLKSICEASALGDKNRSPRILFLMFVNKKKATGDKLSENGQHQFDIFVGYKINQLNDF